MIEQRQDLPVPELPLFSLPLRIQCRAALGGAGFPLSGPPWPAADGAGGSGEPTTPARTGCGETLGAGRDGDMAS